MVNKAMFRRNLFEIENARNLTRDEVVQTFVPNQTFWRMLSAKNHVLLGSRGSGKTAVAKMLSHEHLSRLDELRARNIIESRAFIGIYVPTRLEWVGGLRNKPWFNEGEKERYFRWRLNSATCLAFLFTAQSCLETYIRDEGSRARAERRLCCALSEAWADGEQFESLGMLQRYLERVEYERQIQIARHHAQLSKPDERLIGVAFDIDLFAPLRRGLSAAADVFELHDDTAWLLCLDEAEFLDIDHQRILNSHLRAHSGNLFFKITTIPYSHHLETTTAMPLDPGHDFEYVYLDRDPVFLERTRYERGQIGTGFARKLFSKRASMSGVRYSQVSIDQLLGPSQILDPAAEEWKSGSANETLLLNYASQETFDRASRLMGSKEFMSQIGRKIHGALVLRHKVATTKGRKGLDVYSGATMAMRCGDANPRRLIRIFNAMLLAARWRDKHDGLRTASPVEPTKQTEILIQFSERTLSAVQSEPQVGADLFRFISIIGEYMRHALHDIPLSTDQVSSVFIDESISPSQWRLVQRAVTLGLLYPNVNQNNPDELPVMQGTYHLAYALAPYFRILPRRGKARSIATIEEFSRTGVDPVAVSELDTSQKKLFDEWEDDAE